MSGKPVPKRAATAPKGRPTRSRNARSARHRVFGSTAQWIAVTIALILAFVILVLVTDGGNFNPFSS